MASDVTRRFKYCVQLLKSKNIIRSYSHFAEAIGIHRQSMSDIIKDKREATVEILVKTCEIFKVNPTYLLLESGEMFLSTDPIVKNAHNISYMSIQAQQEYRNHIGDPIFFQELPKFSIPDLRLSQGQFVCFEIEGDSMEPTYHHGDKAVCVKVDEKYLAQIIKTNNVYVIVCSLGIFLRRIVNEIETNSRLVLLSDNEYYEPTMVDIKELKEVWRVEMKLSKQCSKRFYNQNFNNDGLSEIKQAIRDTQLQISHINKSLDRLIK